ncbi:MAG: ATP synthase F1 subunit gamma [Clostridia bacterium]|nr:ATP synthase F1 subunit gamma [Clostridia bacterium]
MGANTKQLKSRIRSVNSTMHITKAMELVASSKFRKATMQAEAGRPYFEALTSAMKKLSASDSVFVKGNDSQKTCYIFIAGDRGLAGGYNNNIFKLLRSTAEDGTYCVIPIGKRAVEYAKRRELEIIASGTSVENMTTEKCAEIGETLKKLFEEGKIGKVEIIYTQYISILSQKPVVHQILPVVPEKEASSDFVLFEPSCEEVLDAIIPEYISGITFGAIKESFSSELAARRTAMDSASKNASEMINSLQLKYNRARQSAITQEITEIIGGAGE